MIDFTYTKKPEFIQFVLIIAVVCLALGAITPSASAVEYSELSFSNVPTNAHYWGDMSGQYDAHDDITRIWYMGIFEEAGIYHWYPNWRPHTPFATMTVSECVAVGPYGSDVLADWTSDYPPQDLPSGPYYVLQTTIYPSPSTSTYISRGIYTGGAVFDRYTNMPSDTDLYFCYNGYDQLFVYVPVSSLTTPLLGVYPGSGSTFDESLDISLTAFAPDDPHGMYVLSLDGSLLDTTYTVGINRYTDEFKYLIDSYAYIDGSGSYTFTGSRSLTLPIYYNSFTNMPYSYEVSINVNDENGYLDERYLVYWSDLGGLYDTVPEPLVPTPKPTPTQTFVPTVPVPSDIIPDPESLNDTVNISGWYQDSGFEGNNITAPIYSGIRGWFNDNLVPVIDFFLTPTNYVATVISDSAGTSTDGISYITEELGSYAAPFNTVGAYVVRLVPEVVWLVVFAALSIGYVILLIRVSTGSIKDTIGRFLGGGK